MSFSTKFAALEHKGGAFEALRFVMVGGAATAVDLTVTVLLVYLTALHENAITTTAFCAAFLVSYFGHRYFTKKSERESPCLQAWRSKRTMAELCGIAA